MSTARYYHVSISGHSDEIKLRADTLEEPSGENGNRYIWRCGEEIIATYQKEMVRGWRYEDVDTRPDWMQLT